MYNKITLSALATLFFGAGNVLGHIELKSPPPINSKFDEQTPEDKVDPTMTSPLKIDGSDYPCKGYNTPENINSLNSVATLKSGSSLAIELDGPATYDGGSCQFSVSYDDGNTWGVIASVIGGCPIGLSYDIKIPDLPSKKKALFAWTWNNHSGNREEYMNCAVVDVEGSADSVDLPGIFRANSLENECVAPEGEDPVYPNPGEQVIYGGDLNEDSPVTVLDPCSYDQDTTVTLKADAGKEGDDDWPGYTDTPTYTPTSEPWPGYTDTPTNTPKAKKSSEPWPGYTDTPTYTPSSEPWPGYTDTPTYTPTSSSKGAAKTPASKKRFNAWK